MSGLSTRSPLLSLYVPGWRSNRLCVIKWWWWLYLTFVKGGAPDFWRSVLSASIQWINPQTEWDRVKMLFLGVNTGVILRWTEVCLKRVVCLLCVFLSLCVCVCVLTCSRHVLWAPFPYLPHLRSGGGWLRTKRSTISPWRSLKEHGSKKYAQNTSPVPAAGC